MKLIHLYGILDVLMKTAYIFRENTFYLFEMISQLLQKIRFLKIIIINIKFFGGRMLCLTWRIINLSLVKLF